MKIYNIIFQVKKKSQFFGYASNRENKILGKSIINFVFVFTSDLKVLFLH